jgi:hypothetical protein
MQGLVFLVVLATSIWVLVDAKRIGIQSGQIGGFGDMGPWGWFFSCLLLWIVGFPLYLSRRAQYQKINAHAGGAPSSDMLSLKISASDNSRDRRE